MQAYLGFITKHWPMLSFGFVCVFWGNFGQSFFLGWYGDAIRASLGLSAQTYGAAYSLATLASAVTVIWAGALIDVWRLKTFTLVVGLGLFIACVLMAMANSLFVLGLGFYCVRLFGQALLPHTGITVMARGFDKSRGKAISLAGSGVPLGEVVLPIVAVMLIGAVGWQLSWWVIAASIPTVFVPTVILLLRVHTPRVPDEGAGAMAPVADTGSPNGRKILFKDIRFWCALPTLMATPFVLTAVFIHQGFLLEQKQWTAQWMAWSFIVFGLVHWAASMVWGVLVDKYSGRTLFKYYLVPLIFGVFFVANFSGVWVAVAMMVFFAITIGGSGIIVSSMWAEVYGAAVLGSIRAAVGGLMVLSTAASPYIFGACIDFGISLAHIANATVVVLAFSLFLLRWSYP